MNIKHRIVAALLASYPAAWRSEYGPELTDMLLARPLSARTIGDVLWNGVRQRVRTAEPSTVVGLAMMLVIVIGFVSEIATLAPYRHRLTLVLQESSKTLPTVDVRLLTSELYFMFLVGFGCWTHLRRGGKLSQSGWATMRICFIAGIPVMLVGVLMSIGVLGVVVLGPGDAPATFPEHGFAVTYYSAQHHPPTPLGVLVSPLFRLPESWMYGMLGGLLGRRLSSYRQRSVASS